jgi:hypothetical protein
MSDLLLCRQHSGRAEPTSIQAYARRFRDDNDGWLAAVAALCHDRAVEFHSGQIPHIVMPFCPQRVGWKYAELRIGAVKLEDITRADAPVLALTYEPAKSAS